MKIRKTTLPVTAASQPKNFVSKQSSSDQSAPPKDTFSFSGSDVVQQLAPLAVLGTAGGSAVYAGMKTAQAFSSGMSGLPGALAGVVLGGISGGTTAFGINFVSSAVSPHGSPSDSMAADFRGATGFVVGAVSGAIAGYSGAQPAVVASASSAAAIVGGTASAYAMDYLMR